MKYYTIYKITNKVNHKIYIGAHKTSNLEDGYMGSGSAIKYAIIKYGKNNFKKEIIDYCKTSDEMYLMEQKLVTKAFIKLSTNYNLKEGGEGGWDYINSLPSNNIGKVVVIDEDGLPIQINTDDKRYLSGKLKSVNVDKVVAKNSLGKTIIVTQKEFDKDSNLVGIGKNIKTSKEGCKNISEGKKGTVPVKDKDGNRFQVSINDPRYLSGELVHNLKGVKLSDERKRKMSIIKSKPQRKTTCPHCGKSGGASNMTRWHFDNCKSKDLTSKSNP